MAYFMTAFHMSLDGLSIFIARRRGVVGATGPDGIVERECELLLL